MQELIAELIEATKVLRLAVEAEADAEGRYNQARAASAIASAQCTKLQQILKREIQAAAGYDAPPISDLYNTVFTVPCSTGSVSTLPEGTKITLT